MIVTVCHCRDQITYPKRFKPSERTPEIEAEMRR